MLRKILNKLENPAAPLLGPNIKTLKFFGLILPKNQLERFFYLFLHFFCALYVVAQCIDVWLLKSDIKIISKNLQATMLSFVSLLKLSNFLILNKKWKEILSYVIKLDLNHRESQIIEIREEVESTTKYCRKLTFTYWLFLGAAGFAGIVDPILKIAFSPTHNQNVQNGTDTYQPIFSFWVPYDTNTIPGVFASFLFQTYAIVFGSGWIFGFDPTAIVIMVFFRRELEFIKMDAARIFGDGVENVSDDKALENLKKLHGRHNDVVRYVKMFDSCLSPIMFLYTFVCTVHLCISAYQMTIETSAMDFFIAAQILAFGVAQLFMFCWHSNEVLYASMDVSMGPYDSRWWNRNVKLRKLIILLSGQFNKTIVFSAGPFAELNVATFITIMKGAYSYYTILRQSQVK